MSEPLQLVTSPTNMGGKYSSVVRWQSLNKHVLDLLPAHWRGMSSNAKWVLLRILANREGYVPDWISAESWKVLSRELGKYSSFNTDTDLLEDSRGASTGGSLYTTEMSRGRDEAMREQQSGYAPQSWREP